MENKKRKRSDLINQDRVRQGLSGRKKTHNISMLNHTWALINRLVETGAGKYGSSFVDHSVRFMIACISGKENINVVAEELEEFIVTPDFSNNLRYFADLWDSREDIIEL